MSDAPTNSVAMQRYAAELFRLQEEYALVPLSLLSDVIGASPQAVSQMVRRMSQRDLLVHEPYRGVRLTQEGQRIAMPALRRHRLTEVFLVRIMGYDWAAAHELADTFEQGINDELEQRIDELKEQIRRSHTRLSLLSDTILSGGGAGSRASIRFQN